MKQSKPNPQEVAKKLVDDWRAEMIQCLAAAIEADHNGHLSFTYHLSNGDVPRRKVDSSYTTKLS